MSTAKISFTFSSMAQPLYCLLTTSFFFQLTGNMKVEISSCCLTSDLQTSAVIWKYLEYLSK